jgi:hypothetical protein
MSGDERPKSPIKQSVDRLIGKSVNQVSTTLSLINRLTDTPLHSPPPQLPMILYRKPMRFVP